MINLVFVFDKSYENPTMVSVLSAIKNNNELDLSFHLIVPFSDSKVAENISVEISAHSFASTVYPVEENIINDFKLGLVKNRRAGMQNQPMNQTVFLKLLLPQILKLDRCIYIDGDTIIGKCIKDLNNQKLGKYMVAAIQDMSENSILKNDYIKKYQLKKYFNSGVLILDLEKMRKLGFIEKAKQIERELGEKKQFADQDIFNLVLNGQVKFIDKRFNLQIYYLSKPPQTAEKIRMAEKGILHFVGPVKPWQNWSKVILQKFWNVYSNAVITKSIEREKITKLNQQLLFTRSLDADEEFKKSSEIKSQIIQRLLVAKKIDQK